MTCPHCGSDDWYCDYLGSDTGIVDYMDGRLTVRVRCDCEGCGRKFSRYEEYAYLGPDRVIQEVE